MADQTVDIPTRRWEFDRVWLLIGAMLLGVSVFVPSDLLGVVTDTGRALGHTGIFIGFAVFMVAYLKARGPKVLWQRPLRARPCAW